MIRLLLAFAVALSPFAAHAQGEAFKALGKEECRAIAVRLAALEGTRLHGIGPEGDLVVFINPTFSGFDFVCRRSGAIGVLVRSETPKPSNAWYALAARTGAAVVNTERLQEIEDAIRECHKEASRGPAMRDIRVQGGKVQCHLDLGEEGDAGAEIYLDRVH